MALNTQNLKKYECLMNTCSVRQEYVCINIHLTTGFLFTLRIPLYCHQLEYFLHFRAKFKRHFAQCQHSRILPCKVLILTFTSIFSFHLI